MNYIVIDLEWNQAMSSDSSVFNKLPIHLRGEIIEIGAVKLDENFQPTEEITIDVKPVFFRRMHYRVKKITGFDKERLANGLPFKDAFDIFREWCGEDVSFITWGCDDQGIFEQNIIIHDLDWEWIKEWINLQLIYNVQTGGDKNQKSLATAMEYFGIEQTRVAHDALGDAYNTALVSTKLDMVEGLAHYSEAGRILAGRMPNFHKHPESNDPTSLIHESYGGYISKAEAFADEKLSGVRCPECEAAMTGAKWINQGDQRYMNIFSCEEHGQFLARLKFKKDSESVFSAAKLLYPADSDMLDYYRDKALQAKRRSRSHSSRRNRPA